MRSPTVAPLVAVLAVAIAIGCGGGKDTTAPPAITSVNGSWTSFIDSLNDAVNGVICNDTGTISLNQTAATFTGSASQSGTCWQGGIAYDNTGVLPINTGIVTTPSSGASTVRFTEPGNPDCVYMGTLTGDPATSMSGTVACVGGGWTFSGTWRASR